MDLPPLGYRFAPTDGELVFHYLGNKVFDRELPIDIVKEIDVYQYDPDQLPLCEHIYANEEEEYYFTTTKPIGSEGTPTLRTTQHGYWKQTGDDEIVMHNEQIVGLKKYLVFYWGQAPNGEQSQWVISECRLIPSGFAHEHFDASVLAKIESSVVCTLRKRVGGDYSTLRDGLEKYQPKRRWHGRENQKK